MFILVQLKNTQETLFVQSDKILSLQQHEDHTAIEYGHPHHFIFVEEPADELVYSINSWTEEKTKNDPKN